MNWEPIWRGDAEAVAEVVAGSLRADGLDARAFGLRPTSDTPAHSLRNEWAVLVPLPQAATARALLRQRGEGRNVVTPGEGIDWQAHAAAAKALAVVVLAVAGALSAGLVLARLLG